MNELINEQIALIQKELEEITNPYERAHIRVLLLSSLTSMCIEDDTDNVLTGKDAIKKDMAKPITFEETETSEAVEPDMEAQSEEPNEIDIDHDPNVHSDEPLIVETEENGEIDIREAYNLITNYEEGTEEDKLQLATNITLYSLAPIYEGLTQLKDCYNKMMLSYYMSEFGLQEINNFVSQLTDNTFNDIYEFINDDNLEGFIINVESAIEEE